MKAQVGLDEEELALNHNTLLNRAISYRLELSPNMQNDDPMAYPSTNNPNQEDQLPPQGLGHQRRSSTDELSFSLAAFRHDEPARKRSRGQSGNSQGSSDNSMGDASSSMAALDTLLDDADETACVQKKVQFTTQPPMEIPPASPLSPVAGASVWDVDVETSNSSGEISAGAVTPSLRLNLGGLSTLTIPTPQDARS